MGAKQGLTLRVKHRLRFFATVFRYMWTQREEYIVENCIMMNFIVCILYRILLG